MNRAVSNVPARERAAQLLRRLYRQDVAAATLDRLWERLPAPADARASQRNDCMLITYADSVVTDDETPLTTLRDFLDTHVAGLMGRVHILPFYPSSSDDGFAVIDYRMVDHHYGGWQEISALADRFDLMFDLVINHCSRENLWFADFVNGRDPGRHYFITLPEDSDVSEVVRPRSTPLISAIHTYGGIRHVWNTFSADQIDLDFSNPEVLCEFVDILFFYIERGATLIRLDAIGFLWKRLGSNCLNLPETHAVVKLLRLLTEQCYPDARLITETNVPHAENVSYFGNGDEAHQVYQFSLAPLLVYSFLFQDSRYLVRWAQNLAPPPAGTTFLNFIASHDGLGLRPLEGLVPEAEVARLVDLMHERGGFVTLREAGGAQKPYEINISLMSAFGGETGFDAYMAAHALLLSFQGTPALYIHSLLGTLNDLDLVEQTGRTRSINRKHWQLRELNSLLQQPSLHRRVLHAMQQLLQRRNEQPALRSDAEQTVLASPSTLVLLRRRCDDTNADDPVFGERCTGCATGARPAVGPRCLSRRAARTGLAAGRQRNPRTLPGALASDITPVTARNRARVHLSLPRHAGLSRLPGTHRQRDARWA